MVVSGLVSVNLVIKLVLPTFESPKNNTFIYLVYVTFIVFTINNGSFEYIVGRLI